MVFPSFLGVPVVFFASAKAVSVFSCSLGAFSALGAFAVYIISLILETFNRHISQILVMLFVDFVT